MGRARSSWDFPLCAHRPQAWAALLCTSFSQDTCLCKVQPPAPGRLPLWGLSECPVSPWELGVLQGLKPAYIQFQHFETSPGAAGGDDLTRSPLLLWGVVPFWMQTPPPHQRVSLLGLDLQPL